MDIEIKVPSLGESETEATLVAWLKQEGDSVAVDDVLAEIESDKITMEITALDAGQLKNVLKQADDIVEPGEIIGFIDDSVQLDSSVATETSPVIEPETTPKAQTEAVDTSPIDDDEIEPQAVVQPVVAPVVSNERNEERVPMSRLRHRIAERLKHAQNTAAMLTTFNEVNLQPVMDLRARFGSAYLEKHGVKLGFMSFFVRAV
ncbi:MAG: biotin/lipoyl-containing protein, partial [Mariprofundus sp.]